MNERKGNKMKTKTTLAIIAALSFFTAVSYAHPPMMHARHHRAYPVNHHTPPPPMHHHRHNNGAFWTGLGVGLIGSTIVNPVSVAIGPTIGRVWVPPVYEMRPVYDRFGNLLRYEQVMVSAGYWRY